MVEQWMDRRFHSLAPHDVPSERTKTAAHVDLIWRAGLDGPERRERPETVRAAKAVRRRVIGDAVAGSDATQGAGLAVTDLHETLAPAEPNMLGRGYRDPVPRAHGAAGAKTRRR